ncbi:MAG: flagellar basal body-associated FliL family protein [Deltaproteobacteria bacterium]|nr:flagellar basal body-associated FliL family protein [Deltaproteobacteria bacterium]MBI3295028.1 flagellar basal body-associated FliL family protein [Deltaproteobacteria bacterium]
MEKLGVATAPHAGTFSVRLQVFGVWLCGIGVVLSAGWSIARIVMILLDPAYAPPIVAAPPAPAAAAFTYVYELKELTFPIFSTERNRVMYVRFSLALDCPSEAAKGAFDKAKARILDTVLEVTANYRLEDFRDSRGFARMKKDLLAALTQRFPNGPPRQISFEDWTIG